MYFSFIPDIQYDVKPVKFPFTSSDFVVAKNFFRRYKIYDDVFSYTVYFNKYAVKEGERPDQIAEKIYGNPFYDWIILLTNNTINPLFDWPMSSSALKNFCEKKYLDPYGEVVYYLTDEITVPQTVTSDQSSKKIPVAVLKGGIKVDVEFYNKPFRYWDGTETVTVPGSTVCRAVTAAEHEEKENESRREIWLLKPQFLTQFVKEFRIKNNYVESSDFVDARLKKTGVAPR